MQGFMIQVRLLQSMHAQNQQRQAHNHSLEENGRRPLISSHINNHSHLFNLFSVSLEKNTMQLQLSNQPILLRMK